MTWIVKIAGCFLLVTGCGLIGVGQARKLKERVNIITDLQRSIRLLSGELSLNLSSVYDACIAVSRQVGGEIGNLFGCCKDFSTLLPFNTQWIDLVENGGFDLDIEICHELKQLGDYFGRYDVDLQLSGLNSILNRLEDIKNNAISYYDKNAKLYRSIGLSVGVVCGILLL